MKELLGRFALLTALSVGGVLAFLVLWASSVALSGWVLTILWSWFISPTFNLPLLTFGQALGVSLIAGMVSHQLNRDEFSTKKDESHLKTIGISLSWLYLRPLALLFFGWLYLHFV